MKTNETNDKLIAVTGAQLVLGLLRSAATIGRCIRQLELIERGHAVVRELAVDVSYKGRHVAWHRLDMVVDNRVVVEIKATEKLPPYAERQLMNYLRASSFEVGLLLHCGPRSAFHRQIDFPKGPRGSG
jgi:GxxExxY protein